MTSSLLDAEPMTKLGGTQAIMEACCKDTYIPDETLLTSQRNIEAKYNFLAYNNRKVFLGYLNYRFHPIKHLAYPSVIILQLLRIILVGDSQKL